MLRAHFLSGTSNPCALETHSQVRTYDHHAIVSHSHGLNKSSKQVMITYMLINWIDRDSQILIGAILQDL